MVVGSHISYNDDLENKKAFTSEKVFWSIAEYGSEERTKTNFSKGQKFGLVFLGINSLLLVSSPVFAQDKGFLPTATDNLNCPGTEIAPSLPPGNSLANVPTTDQGAYAASALGICGIAMKSGAFYIGFICAAAVIVGVRMATVPANAVW